MKRLNLEKSGGFIGVGGMTVALFVYGAMVTLINWWGVAVLLVFWLLLFPRTLQWFATRPVASAMTAVAAFAVWPIFVIGGAFAWGWTPAVEYRQNECSLPGNEPEATSEANDCAAPSMTE